MHLVRADMGIGLGFKVQRKQGSLLALLFSRSPSIGRLRFCSASLLIPRNVSLKQKH